MEHVTKKKNMDATGRLNKFSMEDIPTMFHDEVVQKLNAIKSRGCNSENVDDCFDSVYEIPYGDGRTSPDKGSFLYSLP